MSVTSCVILGQDSFPQKKKRIPFSKEFWPYLSLTIVASPSIPLCRLTVPQANTTRRMCRQHHQSCVTSCRVQCRIASESRFVISMVNAEVRMISAGHHLRIFFCCRAAGEIHKGNVCCFCFRRSDTSGRFIGADVFICS